MSNLKLPGVDQWLANSTVLSDEEFGGTTKKKKGKDLRPLSKNSHKHLYCNKNHVLEFLHLIFVTSLTVIF